MRERIRGLNGCGDCFERGHQPTSTQNDVGTSLVNLLAASLADVHLLLSDLVKLLGILDLVLILARGSGQFDLAHGEDNHVY